MIFSPELWLRWAQKVLPPSQEDWCRAMKAEFLSILNYDERNAFAFGCFRAALFEALRSRKGLNYIARGFGASLILSMSAFGILCGARLGATQETLAFSKLITGLCLSYMVAAGLLIASLRGLKIYAGIGFGFAAIGWIYFTLARPSYETLSSEFLAAVNIEAAGLMASLFLASIYLNWLYSPEAENA